MGIFRRAPSGESPAPVPGGEAQELLTPMVGGELIRFGMDTALRLEVGSDFLVTIESDATVSGPDGEWTGDLVSGQAAELLIPLLFREVARVQIALDGTLTLGIGDTTLSVPPDPGFESWHVNGPDRLLVVCTPGTGNVSIFGPVR